MAVLGTKTKLKANVRNGSIIYKNETIFSSQIRKFEGKNVVITIENDSPPISEDLYAFYFGIIIRKECLGSDSFMGNFYSEKELHEIFQYKLRRWVKTNTINGKTEVTEKVDDVLQYSQEDFAKYINDLKIYLEAEFGIVIKDYKEYIIDKQRYTKR